MPIANEIVGCHFRRMLHGTVYLVARLRDHGSGANRLDDVVRACLRCDLRRILMLVITAIVALGLLIYLLVALLRPEQF